MSARRLMRFAPLGLGLGALAALVVWLARTVNVDALAAALREARLWPLLLMAALAILAGALRALRLHVVLQRRDGFAHTFHANNVGNLMNCLLPLRSGEVGIALLMGPRLPGGHTEALSRLFVDRLLDALAVLALFAITLPLLDNARAGRLDSTQALLLGGGGAAALVAAMWLACMLEAWALRCVRLLMGALGRDAAPWERRLAAGLDGLRVLFRGRVLLPAGTLSLATWALTALAFHVGFATLFPSPGATCAMVAVCLTVLGLMVAPMPAGIGTTHGAIVLALGLFGIGAEQALAFAILYHALSTAVSLLLGLIGLRALGLRLLPLLKGVFAARPAAPGAP